MHIGRTIMLQLRVGLLSLAGRDGVLGAAECMSGAYHTSPILLLVNHLTL